MYLELVYTTVEAKDYLSVLILTFCGSFVVAMDFMVFPRYGLELEILSNL